MLDHHLIKSAYTAGSWLVHESIERTPSAEEYEDCGVGTFRLRADAAAKDGADVSAVQAVLLG